MCKKKLKHLKGNDSSEIKKIVSDSDLSHGVSLDTIEGILERVSSVDPEAAELIEEYIVSIETSHSGPMPTPTDLANYSLTLKSLPERMMTMAEKSLESKSSQNARLLELKDKEISIQSLEANAANESHKREIFIQILSLIFAFTIVLVCIVGALYLAIIDKTEVALAIGGTTVLGIVIAFLKKSKEITRQSIYPTLRIFLCISLTLHAGTNKYYTLRSNDLRR